MTEKNRIVDEDIPPYVRRREEIEDASSLEAWDGWAVTPTGIPHRDYELGRQYADIAIRMARQRGDASPITFTLSSIYIKQHLGLITAGDIERGFVDRIASRAMAASLN